MLGKEVSKKQEEKLKLLGLVVIMVVGYYFFILLPQQREGAQVEINRTFRQNSDISPSDLDSQIWRNSESWEEYLESLYFTSQIKQFTWQMKKEIRNKAEELVINEGNKIIEERRKAIEELENSCTEEERSWPAIEKILEKYNEKIDRAEINGISDLLKEAGGLIREERVKKQGLHWKRKNQNKSWADRWLVDNTQTFEQSLSKMRDLMKREPEHFNIAASYKIKFPPTLWNELNDEEKTHKKVEEITLGEDVPTYKFSILIETWESKVKQNPIRGERDLDTKLDNNALFYGAPRTGKSVMAEKLAYEADRYPLVVIQGSSLTPRDLDYKSGIDNLGKFIFTLCDIDYVLTDELNYEREENGEVRYILFIDEANQITTSTLLSKSSQLTFLKECMGSDNRINESQNLWIAATNHLDEINGAVYQPGRLSNPLDFSWTLGDFIKYADDAGISSNFPQRWTDKTTLSDEDNKWVNRFNKMYFDNDFLPFWRKFIAENPDAEYEPEKEEGSNDTSQPTSENEKPKKLKIKWGEMFEFFWRLFDSKQLEYFDGKFTNPRRPKIEEVVKENLILTSNQISKNIDIRLKGLDETAERTRIDIQTKLGQCVEAIEGSISHLTHIISEIGKKI